MHKIDKHIEIVSSNIPELSSMGEESRNAIKKSLSRRYSNVGITIVNDLTDLNNLVASKPDLVFLGMKFVPVNPSAGFNDSDKIWVYEYLTGHGVTCTGSSSLAHRLDLNKPLAKQCAIDAGLATSPFFVTKANRRLNKTHFKQNYPMFVKPNNRGGGSGIDSYSVVHNFVELKSKVDSIYNELGSDSIIEQYLTGREFSVAIMYSENQKDYLVMPIELFAPKNKNGDRLLSSKVKDSNKEQVSNVIEKSTRKEICNLAISVFHSLGASDYGRIDIRLDHNNVPQFLEANLIPSLITGYGSFPKACVLNYDLDYDSMLVDIVKLGLKRSLNTNKHSIVAYSTI